MTTIRQLSLTDAPSIVTVDRQSWRGISVTARDEKDPARRGHKALSVFSEKYLPAYIKCHPEDAAAIGAVVDGIPVIATGKARNTYLLGPLES